MKQPKAAVPILIKTYLLTLSIFSIFRFGLYLSERYRIHDAPNKWQDTIYAFFMGLRFDLSLVSYILILPALVLLLAEILGWKSQLLYRLVFICFFVLFTLSFLISAADIPYFSHFFAHFSIGAFAWVDNFDMVSSMIFSEPIFYLYFLIAFAAIYIFYKVLSKIFAQANPNTPKNPLQKSLTNFVVLVLIFLGLRGSIGPTPLVIGDAYFCNDPFLNQLGHSPAYFFMRSYLDQQGPAGTPIHFMEQDEALSIVQEYLGKDTSMHVKSPLVRKIIPESVATNKPNVVVILMESMSTGKMARYGNPNNLTPFLDSLSHHSCYFDNLYSAGEHTFNGIFGTLFSYPSIYRIHPLRTFNYYNGWPYTMHKLGYKTIFFTTHNASFDNMGAFLNNNDFEKIYQMKDYPKEEIKTTFGVPDDYLFRYAMPVLDELNQNNQPFFATLLTTSDHRPYFLPDYFTPTSDDVDLRMTQYADWSIKQFFELAKTKPWFDNTIFVLLGDHGYAMDVKYDISLNYHHIPMFIYAPKFVKTQEITKIAGQIDCYPTVMGIIRQPYVNTTLGIDLRKKDRPYIVINGDDKLAVLDNEFLLIEKLDHSILLFKYKKGDRTNYASEYPERVLDMLRYMHANNQTAYEYYKHANEFLLEAK